MTRARVLADLGNSGTFSANADTNRVGISSANPTATLDVTGDVNVSSAATFGGNVTVGGVLTYEDVTNVDSVGVLTARLGANISGGDGLKVTANGAQITGVSTFSSAIDANGDLDVDGQTDLDNLVVAGVTTTAGLLDINAGGQANTFKVEDLTDNRVVLAGTGGELEDDANLTFNGSTLSVGVGLDVDGHTELDNLNVSGVSTFSAAIDLNAELDVDGQTDLDNLVVAGVSTFSAAIDLNAELDVDGQTDLDTLQVAGVSTFSAAIDLNAELDVDGQTDLDTLQVAGVSTFASNVFFADEVQVGDGGGSSNTGIRLNENGYAYFSRNDAATPFMRGYRTDTGANTFTVLASGNATFSGRINVGTTSLNDYAIAGFTSSASYGGIYSQNDNTSGNLYIGQADGSEVFKITATGSARLATGAFVVESDGDISTNIRGHGHIELDSTGGFSSPKIKLFSNTGNGTFAGDILSTKSAGTIKAESSSDSKYAALYAGDSSNDSAVLWQNGDLRFYNTTTRVTINRGGQVLVGHGSTSSHAGTAPLQVTTASSGAFTGQFRARSTNDYSFLAFTSHDGTEDLAQIGVQRTAASKGQFVFYTNSGNANGIERMRLEDLGAFRTYMSGTAARFHLASDQAAGSTILLNCVHSRTAIATGGTASCRIFTDGDIENTNNSYNVLSDENLKENIVDANSQWDDIKDLRVRNFNFKEETGNSTHTQIGVVAQEVELVSPGLVKVRPALTEEGEEAGDTVKTVRSTVLYMKAVKALQEAMERIETLEQRLTDAGL